MFSFVLLAGGAFCFLAFVFAERCCVCHECDWFPLVSVSAVPTGLGHFAANPGLTPWANIFRPSGAAFAMARTSCQGSNRRSSGASAKVIETKIQKHQAQSREPETSEPRAQC